MIRANASAPASLRKQFETFWCTLSPRRSRSAWLLSKGMVRSSRKARHRVLVQEEPFEEITGRRLRQAPSLPRAAPRPGGGLAARPTASSSGSGRERLALGRWHLGESQTAGVVGRRVHLLQQRFEVLGPGLLVFFLEEGQFAQVVDSVERMATLRVGAVAGEVRRSSMLARNVHERGSAGRRPCRNILLPGRSP